MKCIATATLAVTLAASIAASPAAAGDQIYAHPGQLVNAGPTKLNFHCAGTGTPTVVFDAGWEEKPPAVHKKHLASEHEHAMTQARLLSLSKDSKQVLVPDSGHYIQLDQPQIVIDAILDELPKHAGGAP